MPTFALGNLRIALAALALAAFAVGCGGSAAPVQPINGGGVFPTLSPTTHPSTSPTATSHATATASPTATATATATGTLSSACTTSPSATGPITASTGGSVVLSPSTGGTYTFTFPAGALSANTTATFSEISQSALPAPLARVRPAFNARDLHYHPNFTQGAGNKYVYAFCANFGTATLTNAVTITGAGTVPGTFAPGTALNIALNSGGTWVDVGTAVVGASGALQSNPPSVGLPGLAAAGNYLIYEPPAGSVTPSNLGIAVISDDGSGSPTNGLEVIHVEDASGNALPVPLSTYVPISTAPDLDGTSLTPDGSRGAIVDGSNSVYFFSGLSTTPLIASASVDITSYGADGDSIASLPNGDEVVVSGNGTILPIISGILSGSPAVADTIALDSLAGSDRDGIVLSSDGKVLLARGASGLTVWSVTATAAHSGSGCLPGPCVGTVTHTYTQTAEYCSFAYASAVGCPASNVATATYEDGRDGMALSPVDSSRAVLVGYDAADNPIANLITGLPSGPVVSATALRIPAARRIIPPSRFLEPGDKLRGRPMIGLPGSAEDPSAVTISVDGKYAFISTTGGIVTLSGVNTGTLAQVGSSLYQPTITGLPSGISCSLTSPGSLSVTLDGKYLIALGYCDGDGSVPPAGPGVLLTIPIGSGGVLGAPVGQYFGSVYTFNDQLVVH